MSTELNIFIAKMLGWTIYPFYDYERKRSWYALIDPAHKELNPRYFPSYVSEDLAWESAPFFSTNISVAWQVVSHMEQNGWHYEMGDTFDGKCYAMFARGPFPAYYEDWDEEYMERAPKGEMPLAICLAARRAVQEST